ncbi:MAG: efflux RND transporter periplasmic adaptor subunit [Geminicoccaceae bacterium]
MKLLIALLMLVGAAGVYWHFFGIPPQLLAYLPQPAEAGGPAAGGPPGKGGPPGGFAIPVETAEVKAGPMQRRLTAIGTLRSGESVTIRPEISGRVVAIGFDEGGKVTTGQMLLTFDKAVSEAEIAAAQARVDLARSNFDRQSELAKRGSGTKANLDEANGELRSAEAALALEQARMSKLTITAPFDGVVGLRNVSIGDYLEAGDEVVNIEQIDPLKVDFRVAENFLSAVGTGQAIDIAVDAYGMEKFKGEVYAIDPLIDEGGRSILLRARLPNTDGRLRPGLFARVELVLQEKDDALQVPETALVPQGADQFVFKVVDGKAAMAKVVPGIRRDGMVEVLDGLKAADVVVTAGQLKIREGAPVQPLPPPDAAPAPAPAA